MTKETFNIHDLEPDEVLFAGDWHGSLYQAFNALDRAQMQDISVIIQLGDFGIYNTEYSMKYLKQLNQSLKKRGQVLYFVDGNHEDFDYLYSLPIQSDGTRRVRSNIYHLPRGFRFTWLDVSFVALGGAHSVDRQVRRPHKSWWPQERVTPEELQATIDGGIGDVLLMHDSPAGAPNLITDNPIRQAQAMQWFPQEELMQANDHREFLRPVLAAVQPVLIVHGHYHDYWVKEFDIGTTKSTIICLDEGGSGVDVNTIASTLSALQVMAYEGRKR